MKKALSLIISLLMVFTVALIPTVANAASECTHSYDGICDTDCNICGQTREITMDKNNSGADGSGEGGGSTVIIIVAVVVVGGGLAVVVLKKRK